MSGLARTTPRFIDIARTWRRRGALHRGATHCQFCASTFYTDKNCSKARLRSCGRLSHTFIIR